MRKQYYFRLSEHGLLSWDVDRLIRLTRDLPRKKVAFDDVAELDDEWAGQTERRSWRAMVEHLKLIEEVDSPPRVPHFPWCRAIIAASSRRNRAALL